MKDKQVTTADIALLAKKIDYALARAEAAEYRMSKWQRRLLDAEEMTAIQCEDGNWNYDRYMHGMANGMLMIVAIMKGEQESYTGLAAPDKWLSDNP